jgi:hypothetical protein
VYIYMEVIAHPPEGIDQVWKMKQPAQTPPRHLCIAAQLTP